MTVMGLVMPPAQISSQILSTLFLKQFDFETPPPALNGETRFRLCLRGGRRRFALTPPEHFQL
jgi:hypothetical protein